MYSGSFVFTYLFHIPWSWAYWLLTYLNILNFNSFVKIETNSLTVSPYFVQQGNTVFLKGTKEQNKKDVWALKQALDIFEVFQYTTESSP